MSDKAEDRPCDNAGKAARSGIWYVISNVMIRAVGIITAPIYTHLLTTAETGYANNFNNYVSIFYVITGLCLIYSVGRAKLDFSGRESSGGTLYGAGGKKRRIQGSEFDAYMSAIQGLSSIFGAFILILIMLFSPETGMLGFEKPVVIILFAYLTLFPSIDYMQYKLRFEYRYKENIAVSVFITVATVVLSVALILLMQDNRGFAKILGTVIPSAAVALICYIVLLLRGRCLVNIKYWKYALMIGLPMIPHGLAMILLARIDVSMIQKLCDYSAVGLYTSGYTIGSLLMFITNAVGNAWIPLFNERLDAGNTDAIRRDNKILMEAGCFMTLCFIAVAPEVVRLLYAEPYRESMWVVAPVALGTLCQYFYTNYVNAELFYKKTACIAVNSCLAAVINVVLNYIFIRRFGYIAAAYTTLAGYFILMLLHYFATVHILKKKIYNDGLYFMLLILTIAAGLLIGSLYGGTAVRYLAAAVLILFLAWLWRRDIKAFFGMLRARKG
ncbi:MAG: oligosaccharide flippase family protein [Lachnospiraceae bacterium]|nr:oligosaccharide flippase family protein [Lachnospiraceae bacterium]